MDLMNRKVLIAGAGKSGIAAAALLVCEGADIVLYDANKKGSLTEEGLRADIVKVLKASGSISSQESGEDKALELVKGIKIAFGEPAEEMIVSTELLIISPGVPTKLDFVRKLAEKKVPIWGEAELGYRFSKGRLAAITGTNGKTTTTSLLGEICASQFESTFVVGNIGTPCTETARLTRDDSVTVAEMSSFQLESIEEFHPQVSMILNITPDHLDRHGTMENYALAKANIMRNQTEDETCILNYEDEMVRDLAKLSKARIVWFSSLRELEDGIFLRGKDIIYKENGKETFICTTGDMNIIGRHNHENAMAAIAGALALGVSLENIRTSLKNFVAVEHRIEYTCTRNGVKYYNDSKGTNPDAAVQAIKAMDSPTILIGGGYDKHIPFDSWVEGFDGKVKKLLLMGQTAKDIANCCEAHGFKDYVFVESMEEAVDYAYKNTEPGDAVLLSPACASWGMFNNYEERGRLFKDLARKLPE